MKWPLPAVRERGLLSHAFAAFHLAEEAAVPPFQSLTLDSTICFPSAIIVGGDEASDISRRCFLPTNKMNQKTTKQKCDAVHLRTEPGFSSWHGRALEV